MASDLTLLLGVEARENVVSVFQRISGEIEKVTDMFKNMGGSAQEAGDLMTEAMADPETTAGILQARMTELTAATDRLAAAQKEFKDATALAASASADDVGALDAQAAAARRYEAALATANKAQMDAKSAAELNASAQAKASTATTAASDATLTGTAVLNKVGPAAAVTAAAVFGIGYESAKAAATYNASVVKIANSGNISEKSANKIGNAFLTMSENTIYSAGDIADAYSQVAGQLGNVDGHALTAKQSVAFMNVAIEAAAASGQSLGSVTSNIARIMQQYHISTTAAAQATGVLYNEGRLTGQNMSQVVQQITRLKGQLGILAPSIKSTAAFMLDLTEHGMNARRASMALSSSLNTLLKTSHLTVPTMSEMDAAMQHLPSSIKPFAQALLDGKETVKQFDTQIKSFTTGTLAQTVVGKYAKSFESLAEQAKSSTGTLNALKLTPVQEELSKLGVSVFNSSGKFIGLAGVMEQVGPKLAAMHNQSKELAVATILFGTQAKAMLPTLLAGGKGYEAAAKAIGDQTAMTKAAKDSQNTYEANTQKLHNTLTALRIEIGNAFLPVMERLMKMFVGIVKPIVDFVGKNKDLVAIMLTVVGGVSTLVAGIWAMHKAWGAVSAAFNDLKKGFNLVTSLFSKLFGSTQTQVTQNGELITSNTELQASQEEVAAQTSVLADAQDTQAIAAQGAAAAEGEADAAMDANPIGLVVLAIAALIAIIYELIKHWKEVWAVIKTVGEGVWDGLKAAWNTFWDFLKGAWDFMESHAKEIFKAIGIAMLVISGPIGLIVIAIVELSKHWKEVWTDILSFFKTVISGISDGVYSIISFFTALPGKVVAALAKFGDMILSVGKAAIHDLWTGIVDGAKAIWDFFSALPGKVMGFVDGLLIDMLHFGEDIVKNIVKGIGGAAGDITKAVTGIIDKIPGVKTVSHVVGSVVHDLNPLNWHEGGTIPGPVGTEVRAVLQAGESVLTQSQMGMLHKAINTPRLAITPPSGGGHVINVNVSGAVYGSLDKFADALGRHLTGTLLPQAGVVLNH